MLDIRGVVSETVIWQYIEYGKSPFQIYNDVDRAFYESINVENRSAAYVSAHREWREFRGEHLKDQET